MAGICRQRRGSDEAADAVAEKVHGTDGIEVVGTGKGRDLFLCAPAVARPE
jgi:hypothetical protein